MCIRDSPISSPSALPPSPTHLQMKQHDVLFLLTVRPPSGSEVAAMRENGVEPDVRDKFGLVSVRGCEVSVHTCTQTRGGVATCRTSFCLMPPCNKR